MVIRALRFSDACYGRRVKDHSGDKGAHSTWKTGGQRLCLLSPHPGALTHVLASPD